jgi:hypothetical protein
MRLALALLAVAAVARAEVRRDPARALQTLPRDKLAALAPLLRHGEVALLESQGARMKQVTVLALVAAPPDLVRQVVATPERYPEFIRNLTRSEVRRYPDGSFDDVFEVDLKLTSFDTIWRYRVLPDGAIDVWATSPEEDNTFRWDFVPAAGGTVLVYYGYTDVQHSNRYIHSVIEKVPSLEHGLALASQLAYALSVKARAEKLARPGSVTPLDPTAKGPGFGFLLARGRVAVVRSLPGGHLADIALLDRYQAPRERVVEVLRAPNQYASFIDGLKRCRELSREGGDIVYETEAEAPIFDWDTRFRLHDDGRGGLDVVGISGDLASAHYRWDLTPIDERATMVVLRTRQDLAAASPLVFGTLFRTEPLFEHGMSVSMALVQLIAFRRRAESLH